MKMLGLMIALTIFYWVLSSYAQTVMAGTQPCPASLAAVTAEHERAIAEVNRRAMRDGDGQPVIAFEIVPKEAQPTGEVLASRSSRANKLACG